jgi:Cd2+-exporting ATPase
MSKQKNAPNLFLNPTDPVTESNLRNQNPLPRSDPTFIELTGLDFQKVTRMTFDVKGMNCSSCEATLKDILLSIEGVDMASVSVVLGCAVVEGTVDALVISRIVLQKAGFKMSLIADGTSLYLRFDSAPKEFPMDVHVEIFGKTVKFTYDSEISAREIFDFYVKRGFSPEVVGEPTRRTPFWNTFTCRVLISILLTIPVLVLAYLPPRPLLYGGIQLGLVSMIMLYVISPLYKSALVTLFHQRRVEMDLLVVMSTSMAYVFSVVSYAFLCAGSFLSEPFWETPAMLITLIMFGRWITTLARDRAIKTIKTLSATNSKTITLSTGRTIDAALLGYDDVVVVQPGETVPTDGIIVKGETEVNEAMFTGEPRPIAKRMNSAVYAGSMNLLSPIEVRVTKLPSENTLAKIRQLIDTSQINKPRIQSYTDRVAGFLGPIAFVAAVAAFLAWFLVSWKLQNESLSTAAITGLTYAISVLAISCPCAIGLAVPMNIVMASGIAAARGILIKDTHALEILHRVKTVVLDKTGTVTKGEPVVVEERLFHDDAREMVKRLVAGARHPIACAMSKYLGDGEAFDGTRTLVGKGLEVKCEFGEIKGGSPAWLGVHSSITRRSLSTFCVTLDGKLIAAYGLADELRPESSKVVKSLQANGVQVYLVSGDNTTSAHAIGRKIDIPMWNIRSNVLPAEKAQFIKELQIQTRAPVLFCGDGVNDAPALAAADVGISFVSAAEITSSAATILLLSNDLWSLSELMNLSRRVYRRIILNFVWAGIYNFFAIALAAGALVVWRIEPRWAGIGELVSVMPVIVVGWSLKWFRSSQRSNGNEERKETGQDPELETHNNAPFKVSLV